MRSRRMMTLAFGALCVAPLLAQDQMRPGRWEVTTQMDMDGVPVKMPAMKNTSCVTPEQARRPATTIGGPGSRGQGDGNCTTTDEKVDGSRVTWKMACTGAQSMSGEGEMVFSGDSYTGKVRMQGAAMPGPMTIELTGQRVGDCEQ